MNKWELDNMFAISFLIFAVAMIEATPIVEDEPKWHFPGHDFDRTPLGDAVDLASMKMLHESFKQADDKNVVTSPLGVLLLLSMYSAGASDVIKEEIVKALGANNYDELYRSYGRLSDKFSAVDPNALTLANKVYVSDAYNLAEEFVNGAVRSYHSEIERIDFSDAKQAVGTINRWGEEKTKGHIKSPVSEDAIDESVVAALVNVIFFQGHWNVPFNATQTQEKDFHVDKSNVVKKQMMHLENSLFYHESTELGAKMIELPYKETNFRMVVVLPNEIDGLPSVLEKVSQKGLLKEVFELSPAGREVHLDMPKFEIQTSLDLKNILPKVGVEKIFTEPASGIVREAPVKVSKAFQKAFVKVDEEGATAGAFTGLVAVNYSSNSVTPTMNFIVDHPFLFAILHEDSVLFAGTYTH